MEDNQEEYTEEQYFKEYFAHRHEVNELYDRGFPAWPAIVLAVVMLLICLFGK